LVNMNGSALSMPISHNSTQQMLYFVLFITTYFIRRYTIMGMSHFSFC